MISYTYENYLGNQKKTCMMYKFPVKNITTKKLLLYSVYPKKVKNEHIIEKPIH